MKFKTLVFFALIAGNLSAQNKAFSTFLNDYFEEGKKMSPFRATSIGDNQYNHLMAIEFTDSYRQKLQKNNKANQARLARFNRASLSAQDQLSYDILKYGLEQEQRAFAFKMNRIPMSQFNAMPLTLAQYGSGSVVQPFKTEKDYENWILRAKGLTAWTDSAIVYFRKGMKEKIVLPKSLVTKILPQLKGFIVTDPTKSVFYGPINKFPSDFSEATKAKFTTAYADLILKDLVPSYVKLHDFIQNEYLPLARSTSGVGDLPNGKALYANLLRQMTTTNYTAEQIHSIGLSEVARIRTEMEKIKTSVNFTGNLEAFFEHMRTDPKFFPYKTQEEVLDAYRAIETKITPTLALLFKNKPKTAFEVRATEAFRAATAAAQYNSGLADGSRPGIFYVPIVDPTKTPVRESLFIHEAIPGHHYQIMLQIENESLPKFRNYGGYTAYAEGWGLYSESLGPELGLYTDPYQRMKAYGDEIHRAIRLVVDTGIHAKGWTREEAINYMLNNEPITEQSTVAEIERYMAMPGQATAYKIGELKLQELRKRYTKQLGAKFSIADFHDQILKDGSVPLAILEAKMERWAKTIK